MDFGFNQEQEALRESVRDFLVKETPPSYARSMADDEVGITDAVWRSIAQLGWLGLTIPEEYGGLGTDTVFPQDDGVDPREASAASRRWHSIPDQRRLASRSGPIPSSPEST